MARYDTVPIIKVHAENFGNTVGNGPLEMKKGIRSAYLTPFYVLLVRPAGFEPAAFSSGG
jgi:hypothetical protein